MPKARQPKELAKREMLSLHEKAAGQLVREMERGTESPFGVSEERQEEQRAGAAARETGKTAALSVYRAGRGVGRAVWGSTRNAARPTAFRQGAGPGNADPTPAHQNRLAAPAPYPYSIGQSAPTPEQRGRALAQKRAKQRTAQLRERAAAAGAKQMEMLGIRPGKPAKSPRKPPAPRLRGVPAQVQTTTETASVAAQRALWLAVHSKQAALTAARGIRAIGQKLAALLKAIAAAAKSLTAALAAGSTAAVLVVVFICLIAMVAGSAFGIFFAAQPTGNGIALQDAVQQLSEDYHSQISEIEQSIPHDRVEYLPSGLTAIPWQDVLSVFAADMAEAENGQPVAVLESAQIDRLEEILWQMNPVSHRTYTESHEEEHTVTDEDGNVTTETVTVTETVLEITIRQESLQDMAAALGFTARQNEQLALLSDPQYVALWMELLGGYTSGGQILTPGNVPAATGPFQWPLPEAFRITSGFGERTDPFTGEHDFHNGTDIAAPEGTPILAAADGSVTLANGTDPWGGGYGYYIELSHAGNNETLYAHCSSICVTPGQSVRRGEVIGYVGSTGESTGNHLHFEVRMNASRIDAMTCFAP